MSLILQNANRLIFSCSDRVWAIYLLWLIQALQEPRCSHVSIITHGHLSCLRGCIMNYHFYFAILTVINISRSLFVFFISGYGHSTPKTVGGKIFCMLYALAGIPLNLVMFQSIGERLNIFVTYLLCNIKKCFKFKDKEVSQTNLILICMVMSNIVVAGGAGAFSYYEKWNYIDSFYYCVITLTTIGFGDYVALQKDYVLQHKPEYVAFSLIFILFGLTVVSAAMNLLVLRFLTMNTEDERKDELEAATAARTAVRLEGDVITANGSIISGQQENPEYSDLTSVCSCTCYNLQARGKHRYSVTRSPGKISHLLPMQQIINSNRTANEHVGTDSEDLDTADDTNSLLQYQLLRQKRNSIWWLMDGSGWIACPQTHIDTATRQPNARLKDDGKIARVPEWLTNSS